MIVVNPNNKLHSPFAAVEPPLWAGLIASYHNADILDAEAMDMTLEETGEAIRHSGQKDVLIVVMGNNPSVSSTPKMPVAEALADRISDLNVSMTGIHPIAVGSKYPVVKKPFEDTPFMPWGKLPMHLYRAHNWHCLDGSPRSPYASIYTSLGCPYNCYYCNIHTLYGGRGIRFRPIDDILKEVNMLAKYGVRNIKIWDELFTLRKDRVLEICSGLEKYDLNIWAYARLDTVNEQTLKAMKLGGINWLAYGFESITDRKFTAHAEEVIGMTRRAGINIIANFMFGLPGDTKGSMESNVKFARKHLFEYVNFYDAKPYPGSQWYEDVKPEIVTWDVFNQYKNISPLRQQTFRDYFTFPSYQEMVGRKFGQPAVDHIKEMLGWEIGKHG